MTASSIGLVAAMSRKSSSDVAVYGLLLVLALVMYLAGLGNVPLRDWDEATRALVAKDMAELGHWLYPTQYGEPYFLKPPLMDWMVALGFRWWGTDDWVARLPGAVSSAIGVPLLYSVGRELFGFRRPALLAAGVFLTLLPVVRHGRLLMLDGLAVTLFLVMLLCLSKSRFSPVWALGLGLALGGIVLTKGLLAGLLGGVVVAMAIAQWRLDLATNPWLSVGIVLGFAPPLAWYSMQVAEYGQAFVQAHFFTQGVSRLSDAVEQHSGPVWFYVLELLKYSFPWLLFWPWGIVLAWRDRQTQWAQTILIGTGVYLGTISLMGTKLPWYIMPLYPFIALAIGVTLDRLWRQSRYPSVLVVALSILAGGVAAGSIYLISTGEALGVIAAVGILFVALAAAAALAYRHQSLFVPVLLGGTYLSLVLVMSSQVWLWELNEAFPVVPVAQFVNAKTPDDALILTSFAYSRPSLDWYSDRRIIAVAPDRLSTPEATGRYLLLDTDLAQRSSFGNRLSLGTEEGFTLLAPQATSR